MPTTESTKPGAGSGRSPREGTEAKPEIPKGLQFPCAYPLKVMGADSPEFQAQAFAIVRRHVPDLDSSLVESRSSREGRYVSYTFHFTATRREQLDELYADLDECEDVRAVL